MLRTSIKLLGKLLPPVVLQETLSLRERETVKKKGGETSFSPTAISPFKTGNSVTLLEEITLFGFITRFWFMRNACCNENKECVNNGKDVESLRVSCTRRNDVTKHAALAVCPDCPQTVRREYFLLHFTLIDLFSHFSPQSHFLSSLLDCTF